MKHERSTYESIEAYLLGRMGDHEQAQWESDMAADASLAAYVAEHAQAHALVIGAEESRLRTKMQSLYGAEQARWPSWLKVLIGLVGLALVLMLLSDQSARMVDPQQTSQAEERPISQHPAQEKQVALSVSEGPEPRAEEGSRTALATAIDAQHGKKSERDREPMAKMQSREVQPLDSPLASAESGKELLTNTQPQEPVSAGGERGGDQTCPPYRRILDMEVYPSCTERPTGRIGEVNGLLEGDRLICDDAVYQGQMLAAGRHQCYVLDAAGCASEVIPLELTAVECDAVLRPDVGVHWELDLGGLAEKGARLEIFSGHTGERVYQEQLAQPAVPRWDGRDEQGQLVPMGLYVYRLQGVEWSQQGELTVIR